MKKKNEVKKRKVPLKNYFILLCIFIITICLTLYINEWIKTYNENKLRVSPLSTKVNEVNINELDVALNETAETILYVSYTNDKNVYDSEKSLLKILNKNNNMDYLIYLNVTDYLENDEYLNILRSRFPNLASEILKAPLFIYIRNGQGVGVINSTGRIVDDSDFVQMIETYEMEVN